MFKGFRFGRGTSSISQPPTALNEENKIPPAPPAPGAIDANGAAPPPPPSLKKWWNFKKSPAPTVQPEKKKEWKFDFENCTTKQNLFDINWNKVEGIQRSAEGSGGAYFVQLSTKPSHTRNISQQILDVWRKPAPVQSHPDRKPEAVVIKGGMDSVQEAIGTALAHRLGVQSSAIRIIPTKSKEGQAISKVFKKHNPVAAIDIKKFKHITIQQYLPGCSLLGGDGKTHLNTPEKMQNFLRDIFEREVSCNGIGRIIAYDVLINMWDRIPVIWPNNGNVGNLFIHNRKPYAIDNIAAPIVDDHGMQEYHQKIRECILQTVEAAKNNKIDDAFSEAVKNFVNSNTKDFGYEISDNSLVYIRKGFLDAVDDWTHGENEFMKVVTTVWNDINDMLNRGTGNFDDNLDNYNMDKNFFIANYNAMSQAYKEAKQQ